MSAVEAPTESTPAEAPLSELDKLELAETGQLGGATTAPTETSAAGEQPSGESTEGEDAGNQAAEPYWPGKFNTVDDLRTGYENLEKFTTQTRQELAAAQQQLEQARQLISGPQQSGPQQGSALGFTPQYQHPAQGYTPEQFEALQYEDPLRASDYIVQQHLGSFASQLAPFLAEQQERASRQDGEVALSQLRAKFGAEVVEKHGNAVAQAVLADEGYYINPQTRQARLETALKAAMVDELLATQTSDRPRDATTGKFVSAEQRTTHVEAGSSGPGSASANANLPQEIRDMRAQREERDRFGNLPPGVTR